MAKLIKKLAKESIGIGIITGSIILAEIGDINRFNFDAELLAYAGLDPSV